MSRFFICHHDDVKEQQAIGREVNGQQLILLRRHQQFLGFLNQCPHRNVTLEWEIDDFLDESGTFIRCATHGALFLPESGECIVGPCQGQFLQPIKLYSEGNQLYLMDNE